MAIDPEILDRMERLAREHPQWSVRQIARQIPEISYQTIHRHLIRRGVRRASRIPAEALKAIEQRVAEVPEASLKSLAEFAGVSIETTRRHLIQIGCFHERMGARPGKRRGHAGHRGSPKDGRIGDCPRCHRRIRLPCRACGAELSRLPRLPLDGLDATLGIELSDPAERARYETLREKKQAAQVAQPTAGIRVIAQRLIDEAAADRDSEEADVAA